MSVLKLAHYCNVDRVEMVDLLRPATLLSDRQPQPRRSPPAASPRSTDRPLAERLADARAAIYGPSRDDQRKRAREVREAMTRSGRV